MSDLEIEVAQAILAGLVKLADLVRGHDAGTLTSQQVLAELATFTGKTAALNAKDDADAEAALEARFGKLEPKP